MIKKINVINNEPERNQTGVFNTSGILHFLRDSFFNFHGRSTYKTFFIEGLKGFNDFFLLLNAPGYDFGVRTPSQEIFLDIFREKKGEIILNDVVVSVAEPAENNHEIFLLFKFDNKYFKFEFDGNILRAQNVWNAFEEINRSDYIDLLDGWGFLDEIDSFKKQEAS